MRRFESHRDRSKVLLRCVISLRSFSYVTSHAQRIIFLPKMKRIAELSTMQELSLNFLLCTRFANEQRLLDTVRATVCHMN